MPFEVTVPSIQFTFVCCILYICTHTIHMYTRVEFLEGFIALNEAE